MVQLNNGTIIAANIAFCTRLLKTISIFLRVQSNLAKLFDKYKSNTRSNTKSAKALICNVHFETGAKGMSDGRMVGACSQAINKFLFFFWCASCGEMPECMGLFYGFVYIYIYICRRYIKHQMFGDFSSNIDI